MTIIKGNNRIYNVLGIEKDRKTIETFLKDCIYDWCKHYGEKEFAARDLVGGDNWDWNGTPLQALYDKYKKAGKSHGDAFDAAAKDAGKLLKKVIEEDTRNFISIDGYTKSYRWVKETK